MCTLGSVCVRSPLPSLVTITEEPVSAIRKLAPVMPTSAARNFSRRICARLGDELRGLDELAACRQIGVRAAEVGLDLVLRQVDGGRDDVARRLAADLDQVFAEIGLDRLDAVAFEAALRPISSEIIDLPLVTIARRPPADAAHDAARILGRRREMHVAAGRRRPSLERLEVKVEMRQRVVLDVAAEVAQRLELRQAGRAAPRRAAKPGLHLGERPLQLLVARAPRGRCP